MQIQKLTYFCQAWMLGWGKGPLFYDAIESWQYGPVIRALYHSLKHCKGRPVEDTLRAEPVALDSAESRIIEGVWRQYGEVDGIRLSRLTHAEGTPWHQTYIRGKHSQIIPNFLIRNYYAEIVARYRAQQPGEDA
jgi:uncharacterized phage-associated protein